MKKLLVAAVLLLMTSPCFAEQGLKVIVIDDTKPLADVRVQIGTQRLRTSPAGEAFFALGPGKYVAEGPKGKVEGFVYKDTVTTVVLQSVDIKVTLDREALGEFGYEGGVYELNLSYDTPLNYEVKIVSVGIPQGWKVAINPEMLSPDNKAKVSVTVPEGSKVGTDGLQLMAMYQDRPIAITRPIHLTRNWKAKPKSFERSMIDLPISYNVQTTRTYDKEETGIDTDLDLKINSNLNPRLSGTALMRFTHAWEPKDTADFIDLRLANLTYMTGLLNITLGRIDLSPIIQSGEYFGSYLTLGQRRFDGLFLFLPFSLYGTAGVDAAGFQIPPAALSAGYFPNFFSFYPDEKRFDNGFIFAELKFPVLILNNPLMLAFNYAVTTDYAYLKYSSLSGDPALSVNLDYSISQNFHMYSEYAICNVTDMPNTTALMVGSSAKNLAGYTFGFVDEVAIEYQIPLIKSNINPLVGGNSFFPDEAQSQQGCWYAKVCNHFDGLEFTLAATNSVGDFTFTRPAANSFEPNRVFILNDRRSANEVSNLGKTLISSSYNAIAYLFTIGARF